MTMIHLFSRKFSDYLSLLAALAVLIAIFSWKSEHFLTARTFAAMANALPDLIVVSTGMTLVLIIGGIDLSVGSVLALSASALGVAMVHWGWPLGYSVALALLVGCVCGALNGAILVWGSIPSFIVTLGTLEIARGLAYWIANSQTLYVGKRIEGVGASIAQLGVSPAFLIALGLAGLTQLVLVKTVWGRRMIAVGANEQAARLSGISVGPIKIAVFAFSGMMAALGGWFNASRPASVDPNGAIGLELSAIAAAVIGGTRLSGGRGSIIKTLLGVLIIAVLQTGLAQVGASEPTKRIVTGFAIVVAVLIDAVKNIKGKA